MRQVAVVGRDHQLPLFARERPYRGGIGVDQRFEKFAQHATHGVSLSGHYLVR